MGKVIELAKAKAGALEKRAKIREKIEMRQLFEVNAYVNHNPQTRVVAGMTHSKTLQHGVDLTGALAKYDKLAIVHKLHPKRFEWGVSIQVIDGEGRPREDQIQRQCVLLVIMPDGVYVLSNRDEVVRMDQFDEKIVEITEGAIGRWKSCL